MNNQTFVNHVRGVANAPYPKTLLNTDKLFSAIENDVPEILFITSYPPRECGIATYSQDLIKSLNNQFTNSFSLTVCALESGKSLHTYPDEVKYTLDTNDTPQYVELAKTINDSKNIKVVLIQHEFGLFQHRDGFDFLQFLYSVSKPVVVVFHTVLPQPDAYLKAKVRHIAAGCASIVVMTKNSASILSTDYSIPQDKISVIEHGTHLVPHLNKEGLKDKMDLSGKKIISTFGLLSSGKSIETTLNALPEIIKVNPDIVFLIIGKTHPSVVKEEGEKYRNMLEAKVADLNLHNHVKFVNRYLRLPDLLEYLQLTDIYLFTSKDPNQAVSGTFSYAMSCGCPIISTPIPHAKEVLCEKAGTLVDFQNVEQLANAVNRLMTNETLRTEYRLNALQRIVPTAWENSANAHAYLVQKLVAQTAYPPEKMPLNYRLPAINLAHIKKMTTEVGMIQFSVINQPDLSTGYTLDDNARAMVSLCMHYELTGDKEDLSYIRTYLNFINYCQQPEGNFLNYVDVEQHFTEQNNENLSDSNGRAIWALGYLLSKTALLPNELIEIAEEIFNKALSRAETMHSTRSMAFVIKGLYYYNCVKKSRENTELIKKLADRIVNMYRHESETHWNWYESYLTYGNSILPEAMLCAFLDTGDMTYKTIAKESFDFLTTQIFKENKIKVISNKTWMQKGEQPAEHGEQPIDVAYTILALNKFYKVFKDDNYFNKMLTAFDWFLGNNHLHQIIYNPCTGGCYDGLEDDYVNLNQGAESTISYLMARLTIEKYKNDI